MLTEKRKENLSLLQSLRTISQFLRMHLKPSLITSILLTIKSLHYGKHMDFENTEQEIKYRTMSRKDSPDWKKLMNFITNTDKQIFRKSLTNINNALYLELGNIALKEEIKRRSKIKEKDLLTVSKSSSRSSFRPETNSPPKEPEIKQYNPSFVLLNKRRNFARKTTQKMSLYETNKILLNFKEEKMKNLIGIYWKKKEDETVKKKESLQDINFTNQINKLRDSIDISKISMHQKKQPSNISFIQDPISYAYIKQKMKKINKFEPVSLSKQRVYDKTKIAESLSSVQTDICNINKSIEVLGERRKCRSKTKKIQAKGCSFVMSEIQKHQERKMEERKEKINNLVKLFRVSKRKTKSKRTRNTETRLTFKSKKQHK